MPPKLKFKKKAKKPKTIIVKKQFLDIASGKKFNMIIGKENSGKINPKISKLLNEGKKIGLPDGYAIDKRNKKVIRTKKTDGSVSAEYRKAIMLRPKDILNNKQNEDIYSVGDNKFYSRKDVLVSGKNYLKRKYTKAGLKIRNGVIYDRIKSNFEVSPLIKKNKNLYNARLYTIPEKTEFIEEDDEDEGETLTAQSVYTKATPTNLNQLVEIIREAYLNDFTPAQRKRKTQEFLLRFKSGEARWFPISALTNGNLETMIDNYGENFDKAGTDPTAGEVDEDGNNLIGSDIIDLGHFRIKMIGSGKNVVGGAMREKMNAEYWETNQPPTKNNECLEGAINRGLKMNKTSKTLRKIITDKYDTIVKGQMISILDIPKYEETFKTKINVFEDRPHSQENVIYKSTMEYPKTIDILLHQEHYFLITGKKIKLTEKDKIDKKKLGIKKVKKCPKIKKNDLKEMLVIFDIETIFNKKIDQYLEPYGVSWVVWDADKKFDYNPNIHNEEPYCYYRRGQNCIRELINFLIAPPSGIIYRPIGFNNSRFDNFAYCECALSMGVLRQSFFADGTILYAVIENTRPSWDASRFLNGFSLDKACKSFNTNPKKAKDLIDHYEIQTYFEKHGWDGLNNLLDTSPKLVLYNKLDCLCLLDLTLKMRGVFLKQKYDILESYTISSMGYKILEDKWSGKKDFEELTSGMDMKERRQMWKKHKPNYDVKRADNYEDDLFWRKSLFAGRTQSFYGKLVLETPLAMVDYKSLYPTTLGSYGHQRYYYPYGKYFKVDKEIPKKCGIYLCDIKHQRCKWKSPEIKYQFRKLEKLTGKNLYREYAPNVIPLRTKDNPLDWFYKEEMLDIYLTSEDIRVLRWATEDPKCVIVKNGYVWEAKSRNLFRDYFEHPRIEKTKQDALKKELSKLKTIYPDKTEDFYNEKMIEEHGEIYSEAIRECMKLQSNGVSGKLLEAIHEDISDVFSTKKFLELEKDDKVRELDIIDYGNGFSIITGKKSAEDVFNASKKRKPSYLGMFCYSFSRGLMYQTLLSRYICLYMDTDSACMPLFEYDRMNNNPHIIANDLVDNGEYGCLEEEVCDLKLCPECEEREERNDREEIMNYRYENPMINGCRCSKCVMKPATKLIAISPKNYAVINSNNHKLDKRKFKGVRKNDFWIPLKDFGEYYYIDKETKERLTDEEAQNTKDKILYGDGVFKVRGGIEYSNDKKKKNIHHSGFSQDEIRQIREFKCCECCIDEVIANTDDKDFVNSCSRCLKAKSKVNKTYNDEMFETLARGEKIVVFCSVINRIKYNIKSLVEWEYADLLNGEDCSLETFEYIVANSKGVGSKNPIQFKFRCDENEAKEYFETMEKAIADIKSKLKPKQFIEDKTEWKKFLLKQKNAILDYINSQHRFKAIDEMREVSESFKMKQTFLTKII